MTERVVLAYSGGLDTSVGIGWLKDATGKDVVALAVDVGQGGEDMEDIRQRALDCGAVEAVVVDAKDEFAYDYLMPALKANALYQKRYPLVSALSRPVIAQAPRARRPKELGADSVAHGCTGKGNDQVRFEAAVAALAPELTEHRARARPRAHPRQGDRLRGGAQPADRAVARRTRTRSTRTSGVARSRPASSRTRGTRRSRTSTSTRRTRTVPSASRRGHASPSPRASRPRSTASRHAAQGRRAS